MAMYGETITVNLLTGFLGSGKTTLLKRLLVEPGLEGTAVLVNEFGEIGLDHLLLEEVDEDVVLLQSGCICCSIRGDLKAAMLRLHGRAYRGEIPAFTRLAIETTGLADPAPIVATLSADPVLRNHYRLGNVVTVIDTLSGPGNLEQFEESRKQIAVADRVVVTKTDLADCAKLKARVAALAPSAEVVLGGTKEPVSGLLFTADLNDAESRHQQVLAWLDAQYNNSHNHDISSFIIESNKPLDWAAFGIWLAMLLNRHGNLILRTKGLLFIDGEERPVVIHGVQHTIHKPQHLDHWPKGGPVTKLVMITKGINPQAVQRSFAKMVTGAK